MHYHILSKRELAPHIKQIEIEAKDIAVAAKAGQFVIVHQDKYAERIPLTLYKFNKDKGTITVIFQEVGKSTQRLGLLNVGDSILNVVGPLGVAMDPSEFDGKVVVGVGGGVGTAPLVAKLTAIKENARKIIAIVGARTKNLLILEDELRQLSDTLYVCTDDGSFARKGLVTDILQDVLKEESVDIVLAIGPTIMMKQVCLMTKPLDIKTLVSLNPIMLDGTGMCGCCRVSVGGRVVFACVDGPVFDGHEVDFDELIQRNARFVNFERQLL